MRSKLSEFLLLVVLAVATVLMAAAACGDNDGEGRAAQEALPPTTEPSTPTPQLGTPTQPAEETAPGEIETAARKLLADDLGADEGDFRLESSEGVGWSDTSLGCPKEGMAYAQVLTPGYKLVFDLAGTSHAVHTNGDGSHMVICRDG